MEKIIRADRVVNEYVLRTVKVKRCILRVIRTRKTTWIGHIWRTNCLLKHVIEDRQREGKSERKARRKT